VQRVSGTTADVSAHEFLQLLAEPRRWELMRLLAASDRRDMYYRVDLVQCREMLGDTGLALHPGLRLAPATRAPSSRRRAPLVLFLCTGNSARSQMAEALLEHRSRRAIRARSAGSHPKSLHPHAVRVMGDRGIDISDRTAKHVRRFARTHFDHVITLCDKVREICPEFPGVPEAAHWSMPDPSVDTSTGGDTYPAFCRTADELDLSASR
jgi:protein-tyrosine-phosphatase